MVIGIVIYVAQEDGHIFYINNQSKDSNLYNYVKV